MIVIEIAQAPRAESQKLRSVLRLRWCDGTASDSCYRTASRSSFEVEFASCFRSPDALGPFLFAPFAYLYASAGSIQVQR